MSVFDRLGRVRAILAVGVVLRALAIGALVGLTLMIGAIGADSVAPIPLAVRAALVAIGSIATLGVVLAMAWRDRTVLSLDRVALWIEEHFPSLEYRLVTAIEIKDERLLTSDTVSDWFGTAFRRAGRALTIPALGLVAAFVILVLLPDGAVARIRSPKAGDSLERTRLRADPANRLSPLVAEVFPPAYSGQPRTAIDEPVDVRALEGSRLTLSGRGDAVGISAQVGASSLTASKAGDRWSITLPVGNRPIALNLSDGTHQRIVAIEPIIDAPPVVTLLTPAHDSVLRTPAGVLPLHAEASDDFGIVDLSFEYIISSGEGESFTFKSGTLGTVRPGARTGSANASLSIDSLALKPGDIVHLRAVARDANTVSGPGVGVSETRAIRIARRDEYDSVAVDAAAPAEADKSMISQRMLIMLTEALQQRRRRIPRDTLLRESQRIGVDQKKLRRAVGDVVFMRLGGEPSGEESNQGESPDRAKTMEELLARADSATNMSTDPLDFEGDETPVVSVNKPLLEAYNAMWDASGHLDLGEPDRALPYMRRALDAIQRARRAERLYLRGTPPKVVIDLDKARLKGKDKGSSSTRRALPSNEAERMRIDRFVRIVELSEKSPGAAADSLLLLRIEALGDAPRFAAALSDAANAIRAGDGKAATTALARARRALAGVSVARDSLSSWGWVP